MDRREEEEESETQKEEPVIYWRTFGSIGLVIGIILVWFTIGKPLYDIAKGADSIWTSVKLFALGVLLIFFSLIMIILEERILNYFPPTHRSRWDLTWREWILVIALATGILTAWLFFDSHLNSLGFKG